MTDGGKRKDAPSGGGSSAQQKKKKMGNDGKWKTSHQQSKMAVVKDSIPQPGDVGIWVTCARNQERKAGREVLELFEKYAETMYGIKIETETVADDGDEDDIDAAIQKEVAAMNTKKTVEEKEKQIFTIMKMNVDCLLFVKTRAPIDPVQFVRRICLDAKEITKHDQMKCRYTNRFTPAVIMGKASETGIIDVAREVLSPFFALTEKPAAESAESADSAGSEAVESSAEASTDAASNAPAPAAVGNSGDVVQPKDYKPLTYAIRPSIRNHSKLKRDFVITEIAGIVNPELHKVNLSTPDKVILIDIYQAVCSMSVVDGDWDELKKYNMSEIYNQALKNSSALKVSEKGVE